MAFEVPEACTLPTAEQPLRLAQFDELFATALRRVDRLTDRHARMHFTGGADLAATVRELAAREAECCSFFDFAVGLAGDAVTLDIKVPAAHVDVLDALAGRAVS
jgi:hypothetical protein